nr:MAG TPA: hypothetical protein [Caudoviricetes sp.]
MTNSKNVVLLPRQYGSSSCLYILQKKYSSYIEYLLAQKRCRITVMLYIQKALATVLTTPTFWAFPFETFYTKYKCQYS